MYYLWRGSATTTGMTTRRSGGEGGDGGAEPDRHLLARRAGLLAPVVTLGAIFAATAISPTFTWTGSALSDLGVGASTALLFNGGLLVGALLALPYALPLWRAATGHLDRLVAVLFACTAVAMGLVGTFPSGRPEHFPVALAFYLLLTATLALDGVARRRRTSERVALALAVLHLLGWAVYVARFSAYRLAIPETVGALFLAGWVWWLSPVGLRRSRGRTTTRSPVR